MSTSVATRPTRATDLDASYLAGSWRNAEHAASYRLPTGLTCELVASLVDETAPLTSHSRYIAGHGEARTFALVLSPGVLRIRSRQAGLADGTDDGSELDTWLAELSTSGSAFGEDPGQEWDGPQPLVADAHPSRTRVGVKREVTEWTRKSRLNMARVLATLDWAGHIEAAPAGWRPQMLTLTLPGDWLTIAPDGKTFKALFRAWRERWRREFGSRWAGCWKLEFQGRGAPHLHLYGNAPTGQAFRDWLSRSWYEVCGSGDDRHLRAGTGVDWREGIRGTDPRSVALYFLGKSVGHNLGLGKEYQHRVPEAWQAPGAGPGRFWGHCGLQRVEVTRELDAVQFVRLRRLVRRWAVANGRRVNAAGWSRFQGYSLLSSDAPAWLGQALRWDGLAQGDRPPRDVDVLTGERLFVGPLGYLP